MQENTKENEYIAATLCRYGGQSPKDNHKQVGAFRVTCTAMSSEKCRGILFRRYTHE